MSAKEMDVNRLHEILAETTIQLRKGEEIEGTPELIEAVKSFKEGDQLPGGTVSIYAMPHESEVAENSWIKRVDCHLIVVGVDKAKAKKFRSELLEILKNWPAKAWGADIPKLESGPSYISAGAVLGDQGAAFRLFALGEVLGFWKVIVPESLGVTGPVADQMADFGLITIDGFDPSKLSSEVAAN
ncbi:MAG: hypothetical protein WCV58_01315 [Patescibacteria group bacterium]|jgi:hypothetical protein